MAGRATDAMELHLPFSSPATPSVDDVEEPSVLEYAREQGICVDYTTDLACGPELADQVARPVDGGGGGEVRDPFDDVLSHAIAAAEALARERLTLVRDAAVLLKAVVGLRGDSHCEDVGVVECQRRIRGLKLELPVLGSDVELDMCGFGKRVEVGAEVVREGIPLVEVDEEKDEGWEWPEVYGEYAGRWEERVKTERLGVKREGMELLQGVVRGDLGFGGCEGSVVEETERGRVAVPRYLTPPLLPLSPPVTPYVPSSPANRLPLLEGSSDSVAAEAKGLEQEIMKKDSLSRLGSGSSDSMLYDVEDLDMFLNIDEADDAHSADRTLKVLKRRADDLKVEGPLTPPILSDSPMKKFKSVSFSDMIQVGGMLDPWSGQHCSETSDSQSVTDELLKALGPIAKETDRKIANEKLTGADTISRVDIPALDFTLPIAPWDQFSLRRTSKRQPGITELDAQIKFLHHVKSDALKSATTWRGVSDTELRWGWFSSSTSTIRVNEPLHGEAEFRKIQAELKVGHLATSSGEVWKRDGLRVLGEGEEDDAYDEEDDIDPAEFEEFDDVDSLIRKRKLELEELEELAESQSRRKQVAAARSQVHAYQGSQQSIGGEVHESDTSVAAANADQVPRTSTTLDLDQLRTAGTSHGPVLAPQEATKGLMFGGSSASNALHRFMESQGKTIASADTGQKKKDSAPAINTPRPTNMPIQSINDITNIAGRLPIGLPQPTPQSPPLFDLPASPFVVSTSLLQRRHLVKEIERLHTTAELIYRDYNLTHSVCTEADIILSPSTGVVLTTLQQIKQAPLPGQVALPPVKERIARQQLRYERLLILISEGLRDENGEHRPEDARDKASLQDLETFAAQLDSNVVIEFVPGGDKGLAKAVVQSMGTYGLAYGGSDIRDIKLLHEETTWEIFLRRAGLNPFAAQVIIASLKTPSTTSLPPIHSSPAFLPTPEKTVEVTGLCTFLLMKREDRAKRFQAVMGGRRILDRVSGMLDQRWVSAVDGFRM